MSDTAQQSEDDNTKDIKPAEKVDDVKKDNKKNDRLKSSSSKAVIGHFEIDPKDNIPEYNNPAVQAYRAHYTKGPESFFALVSENHLIPRHGKMDVYESIINPHLSKLVFKGKAYWPPAKQERYFLIYHDNLGNPFVKEGASKALSMKSDIVMERILKPFIGILQDFRDKDFVHGNIRIENLFDGGSSSAKMVLGDCLSAPPGFCQSAAHEPIDRAMADPVARGPGKQSSDIYAFGVLLASFLRQNDPFKGLSDDQIIQKKIDMGSYAAVTGKERFTGPILELLRGTLHDDTNQRWTIDEILTWSDGRRLSPKQAAKKLVAPRPIVFCDKKYSQPITLAMNIANNPQEARRIIDDGELRNWFERSLERPDLFVKLESVLAYAGEAMHTKGQEDRLVSHLSMGIDPDAPIRFKGLRLHPDGVGTALAETYSLKRDLNVFADLFNQNIVMSWVKIQNSGDIDIGGLVNKFDKCRMALRQQKIGFGLERCLYTLNPESPCMSPKIKDYYVLSPEDLLMAYEDLCEKGKEPSTFVDRHIAAFLSVKEPKVIDGYLADFAAPEHYKHIQASLNCFALIQRRSKMPMLPSVASAFANQLNVVYKRYHDRNVRETLKKNIGRYARDGDLAKMAGLLDNNEVKMKDFNAFKLALREYRELENEHKKLEAGLADKDTFGISTGQEASAVISSVISGIIILFVAFLYFSDGGVF